MPQMTTNALCMLSTRADISLRPVAATDDAFLRALYAQVRAPELAATEWTEAQKQHFCNTQFDAQDSHYRAYYPSATLQIIETIDAQGIAAPAPVGRLYWVPMQDAKQEVLMEISIVNEARGKGIGTYLITQILARAVAQGSSVSLHVEPHNPAHRLYERLGFTVIDRTPVYDEMLWRPPTI